MIRSFIFDIGNVLVPFDFNRAIRRLAPQCAIPLDGFSPPAKAIVERYECGQIGRAEFLQQAIALLEYTGSEADFVAAWEDIFEENCAMTRLVASLHGRYPLYLLSNTSDIHAGYFEAKYPVFQYFSGAVYSHLVRCMKPGRPIFEIATRQFGVEPGETVYIDDLAPNVATARALGFHALQYDHTRHAQLVEQLAALGVGDIPE
ncbi:MAG: HAD family phosphatase [Verrucomicrobiota bacterium]